MSKEIKVAILAVVTGVIIYFGFNFLKGVDFLSPVRTYYLIYDDINGLTISNPVVVNGLTVGKVKDLQLLQDGKENKVKVTIEVRDEIEIGDGTKAILKSSDLLGGKMIFLNLGVNKEVYKSGKELNAGTEKSITEILEEASIPVIENVDTTITKLQNFIDADDKSSFKAMVKNMEATTKTIQRMANESRQNTSIMYGNLIKLTYQLSQTEQELKPLIQKMSNFGDSLNTLDFDNTLRMVDNSIQSLDSIMLKINSTQGTMGMLLNDKELYTNINSTLDGIDSLLVDFDRDPNKYLAPLGKNAKQVQKAERKAAKKQKN